MMGANIVTEITIDRINCLLKSKFFCVFLQHYLLKGTLMFINSLLLLIGFVLLIVGAGKLVEAASSLARKFNIPEIVIGLTIVALGTSSPELVVNLVASSHHESAMVLGNVIGSNIFNVLVILGVTALVKPLTVNRNTTWLEIPLSLMAAVLVLVASSDIFLDNAANNSISRSDGIILIGLFLIFLVYNLELAKKGDQNGVAIVATQSSLTSIVWIIAGLGGLIVGGQLIVDNATALARSFGVSERVIAITVVSTGTSLPELATSLLAVKKGKLDMAIGNVVGSSIFNIFLILGASSIVNPIQVAAAAMPDIYLNIIANLLLFTFLFLNTKRCLRRWEGFIFLVLYICYLFFLLFPDKFYH